MAYRPRRGAASTSIAAAIRHPMSSYLCFGPNVGAGGAVLGMARRLREEPPLAEALAVWGEIGPALCEWWAQQERAGEPWAATHLTPDYVSTARL